MNNSNLIFVPIVAALFFSTGAAMLGLWSSISAIVPVYAQTTTANQTMAIDQLTSNITQAKEAIASGNATATAQLTNIIGELSDVLGNITSDKNGQYLDEHTHFFAHKGHTHTVTHKHPHNADHHHHDWFQRHHIFNPSDCKPGRLC